jgi:hypothetical protein
MQLGQPPKSTISIILESYAVRQPLIAPVMTPWIRARCGQWHESQSNRCEQPDVRRGPRVTAEIVGKPVVRPTDIELVRLGRSSRQVALGVTAVAALLAVAVVKPWPGPAPAANSDTPEQFVAAVTANVPSAAASSADPAGSICTSPDGWRIVADDVELGRPVRTWLVASVEYSAVPPVRSTVPVTSLVSSGVSSLSFCLAPEVSQAGKTGWSGTLWRQSGDAADPAAWQPAARLTPFPGSIGALAAPLDGSATTWPPGRYVLEARFAGSPREAWLGLLIRRAT